MTLYQQLVNRSLPSNTRIRILSADRTMFVGEGPELKASDPANPGAAFPWYLVQANWPGNTPGYWIMDRIPPPWHRAWTARNGGQGIIGTWNWAGSAHGSPQNDEIFYFQAVDEAASTVRIVQTYGSYVKVVGPLNQVGGLTAGAGPGDASTFYVQIG